jgi:G3E family GTPase
MYPFFNPYKEKTMAFGRVKQEQQEQQEQQEKQEQQEQQQDKQGETRDAAFETALADIQEEYDIFIKRVKAYMDASDSDRQRHHVKVKRAAMDVRDALKRLNKK